MRLGRVVFLAGLAPLLGWAAAVSAHADASKPVASLQAPDSLASLLRTMVVLVSADISVEPVRERQHRPAPQFMLELTALAHSPLGHSLWMVAASSRGGLPVRPPLIQQLRC